MAITIRTKRTEAMIREIGRRHGEGPSAVIRRLAEQELGERRGEVSLEEYERRMRAWDELDKLYPPPTEEEKEAMRREMETMYDYLEQYEQAQYGHHDPKQED